MRSKINSLIIVFLSSLFLHISSCLFAEKNLEETKITEGKKGERIKATIEAITSHHPEQVKRFFIENCSEKLGKMLSLDEQIKKFLLLGRQTGKLYLQFNRQPSWGKRCDSYYPQG